MKIKKIQIEGLRGSPKVWEINFKERSAVIQGQNGKGKSTIADAIEFWSTGEIEDFKREGYAIDAAINVEHGGPARVAIRLDDGAEFERILDGSQASELARKSDQGHPPTPVPILRHKSIARFMFKSAGEKRAELLPILGLDDLLPFKSELVTSSNSASKAAKLASSAETASAKELSDASSGQDVVVRADELRKIAGLEQPINDQSDLLELDLSESPGMRTTIEWVRLVESIEEAREKVVGGAVSEWNKLVADRESLIAASTSALLKAGFNLLDDWPDDSCPLCLSDFERSTLRTDIERRTVELEALAKKFSDAESDVKQHIVEVTNLDNALKSLLSTKPQGDWPSREKFEEAESAIADHADQCNQAIASRKAIPEIPRIDLKSMLEDARKTAEEAAKDASGPALAQLERLRIAYLRHHDDVSALENSEKVAKALKLVLDIAEAEIKSAVEAEVQAISELTAEYFGKLVSSPVYSDVMLKYDDRRQGGVEFELTYKSELRVKPPQRIVSESQLNALGIALFLARCKTTELSWRSLVLDDVVNSFDSDHRVSVAKLLRDSFSDWQVVFLTHDKTFTRYAEEILPDWYRWRISHWTPEAGPVLGEVDPRAILKEALDSGADTSTLGGVARVALEMPLERIVNRLSVPIRYDRKHQYSANDYLDAIDDYLVRTNSTIRERTEFGKLRAASYVTVLAAHDKNDESVPSEGDLRNMLEDLAGFEGAFLCDDCEKPVWYRSEGFASSRKLSCECEKLKL